MVDCFSLLINDLDVINAAICPFINAGGGTFGGWFFALVIFAIEAGIYLKTQNLWIPSVLGLFISGAIMGGTGILGMETLPGYFFAAIATIFILNLAIMIFGIFKSLR